MRSKRVQAAVKDVQEKRIAAKTKKGYVDTVGKDGKVTKLGFFASQQEQVTAAAVNKGIRTARLNYATAIDDLGVAEITGDGLEAARENVGVTQIVLQKSEAAKRSRTGAALTNAGSI